MILIISLFSSMSNEFMRSVMSDSVTTWTVACQAPLSIRFSRPEYWSGLPFPSPGNLPNPGIKPMFPALAGGFLTTSATGEAPATSIPAFFRSVLPKPV